MRVLRRTGEIITRRRRPRPKCVRGATLAALLLAFSAGPVGVAQAETGFGSNRLLWATVNVCDTAAHPDTIGIRASMPGTASGREVMFMRFRVQYLSAEDDRWHYVPGQGDSGFLEVGRANVKARQRGRHVTVETKTDRVALRGLVTFDWRLNKNVVRRVRRYTHSGHKSKAGADPPDYSAARCTIKR